MKKVGLFGGTFDPLHNGHVELVRAALRQGLDRVVVMPVGRPPHKSREIISMAGYRFEMAAQAFDGLPGAVVSDREILRPGPSYTLDTIGLVRGELAPDDELVLVYGSDVLENIEKWHEPAAIMASCPMLVAQRGGTDAAKNRAAADRLCRVYGARITFFDAAEIELSSSSIRRSVESGVDCRNLMPEKVAQLINKHGLYRYQAEMESLGSSLWHRFYEIERLLWTVLSRKRLLHSLNVLIYSLHLALVHDVPPEQAGVAALLHDCAKCLPKSEAVRYARESGETGLADPALAHGPAGCRLAGDLFAVDDPAILRAVLYHTTGCADMGKLEQIIFIADKVEPARPYPNLDEIRRLADTDLDAAMMICLREIDSFLQRESLEPHPLTLEALEDCARRIASRKEIQAD